MMTSRFNQHTCPDSTDAMLKFCQCSGLHQRRGGPVPNGRSIGFPSFEGPMDQSGVGPEATWRRQCTSNHGHVRLQNNILIDGSIIRG